MATFDDEVPLAGDEAHQNLVRYRLERAQATLVEATEIARLGFNETAINRLYYACYYAVSALLLTKHLTSKTHTGTRTVFYKEFVQSGIIETTLAVTYSQLFNRRHESDYNDFIRIDKEEVQVLTVDAHTLLNKLTSLINTWLQEIESKS
jgi:uncharacterized protein (UPF0332 family)